MATHFAGPFFSALSLNSFNRFRWICMETTFDKKELKFLLKFMQMKEGRHIWLYRRKLQTPNSMLYLSLSLSLTLHNGTNLMARNFVILTRCFCDSGQCHNNKIKGRWFYYLFHYIEKINLMSVSIAPATLIYTHLQCRESWINSEWNYCRKYFFRPKSTVVRAWFNQSSSLWITICFLLSY